MPPPPEGIQSTDPSENGTAGVNPAITDAGTDTPRELTERVRAEQAEHTPLPAAMRVEGRVRATPSGGNRTTGGRPLVDAKRCQDLAYLLEEADGQDRYPLKVDHLQGYGYFGCDLLSFASAGDRDAFVATQDDDLVLRFIEVKGSGSDKGTIHLEGNELESARKNHDRFYLYRVFEKADGTFEVVALKDPLAGEPKVSYQVNLFRDPRVVKYEVDLA